MTLPELVRRINTPVGGRQHAQSSRKSSLAPQDKSDPNAIPVRLIQQALVVLIQHHCVQHSRPSGSHSYADEEFFEVDVDEVLCRLRFGNYMSLAQEWGGDDVHLVDALKRDPTMSGTSSEAPDRELQQRAASLRDLLARMLLDSLVRPSTPVQHVSLQDRALALESMLQRAQKGVPTAKSLREIKAKVAAMIDEEDRREWEGANDGTDDLRLGLKRKVTASAGPDKRSKRHANSDVSTSRADVEIDLDVWLRVHYDYFHIQIRNEVIASAISNKYNAATGEVMRLMLQADHAGLARCEKDELRFLAPFGSSTTVSAGGSARVATSFTIEYVNILKQLQLQMVRNMVVDRFGAMAGRIFSILVEKGKLEEKHISKIGLISMGETRDVCSRLFASSILSLQEVPKGSERNPQRTFFLWFVDVNKCKAWLLDHLYKTLGQLSRRRLYEQARKASLLRKAERTDVREAAEALLTDWERKELASLQSLLEAITVAEARVLRDAFILQHFST
ncbi:RNA polymerase III subunit C82 [Malassezia equina]|uniref:DNA-directed RNA polymerase III subunit RPC3 n=1 Tax=Malassezia equina TaxID=1381935 RepID=A0AAF0EHC6_9BASI|nr:RNA polymerase III subunit C82 [Malassezia equina]